MFANVLRVRKNIFKGLIKMFFFFFQYLYEVPEIECVSEYIKNKYS